MKKLLIILLAGTFAFAGSARAESDAPAADLVVLGTYYIPEDDDVYDDAGGAELQLRLWMNEYIGLSLVGGWSRWNFDDQTATFRSGSVATTVSLDGDIDVVPVGASLLIRIFNNDSLSLILEGGARYMFVDDNNADVNVVVTQPGASPVVSKQQLKLDDGVVALAGAQLEFKLSRDVFLTVAGAYQWDIDEGDVEFLDEDIQDNNLEGALVQAGLGVRF